MKTAATMKKQFRALCLADALRDGEGIEAQVVRRGERWAVVVPDRIDSTVLRCAVRTFNTEARGWI